MKLVCYFVVIVVMFLILVVYVDVFRIDVVKSVDYFVLKCFVGSVLVGYDQQDWEQCSFFDVSGVLKIEDKFVYFVILEGKVIWLFYLLLLGKSLLEVFCNYQQVLNVVGFKVIW